MTGTRLIEVFVILKFLSLLCDLVLSAAGSSYFESQGFAIKQLSLADSELSHLRVQPNQPS
jgi:hypothetical protein